MPKASLLLILLVMVSAPAVSQPLSFGVVGGLPLLYGAPAPCCSIQNYTDESRPYTVGPAVEFHFSGSFGIEIDALYRRLGLRDSGFTVFSTYDVFTDRWRGNAWEFPLMAKYYFRRRQALQPFIGAGMAMRYLSRQDHGNHTGLFGSFYQSNYSDRQFIAGETVAGGIRVRTGRVQWLPQVRYTRWNASGILTESNEAAILLGFAF